MIQEARYTSPSGKETTFSWESAKRETQLKTGVYTFPQKDGAHVQHQGAGARTFPLSCIFSGSGYMEKADEFELMLTERGIAELQHPVYGVVKVVPTGNIEREDNLVERLNESVVNITFTETITSEAAAKLETIAAESIDEEFEEFSEAAVSDFALAVVTENIAEQAETTKALETQTQLIINNLQPIAESGDKKEFADWLTSAKELKENIKNLYTKTKNTPMNTESIVTRAIGIARLTLRLMKRPSDIAIAISEKIKGYSTLIANLVNQYKNEPFGIGKIKASYTTATLALTGAVSSIASGSALTVAEAATLTGAAPVSPGRNGTARAAVNLGGTTGAGAGLGGTSRTTTLGSCERGGGSQR
jgi:hypothetical protein